jgi:hypothetical protein
MQDEMALLRSATSIRLSPAVLGFYGLIRATRRLRYVAYLLKRHLDRSSGNCDGLRFSISEVSGPICNYRDFRSGGQLLPGHEDCSGRRRKYGSYFRVAGLLGVGTVVSTSSGINANDGSLTDVDSADADSGTAMVPHCVQSTHSKPPEAIMCEVKEGAQSKIDRLIQAIDRLSEVVERSHSRPSEPTDVQAPSTDMFFATNDPLAISADR